MQYRPYHKKNKVCCVLLCLFLLLCRFFSCFSLDPQRLESPYYKEGRFHNLDPDKNLTDKNLWDVLYWKLFGSEDPPTVKNLHDLPPKLHKLQKTDLLAPPGKVRIVWLGHATTWIAVNQNNQRFHIITDPIFGDIGFTQSRLVALPIPAKELPAIDLAIVSHCHRDHFDINSLRFIQKQNPKVRIFLPDGTRMIAKDEQLHRAEVIEWWQKKQVKAYAVEFTPAHHWSRMGLNDNMQCHWGSYVLHLGTRKLYFGGDTGYSSHFKKIARRHPQGFAAALLPIGAFKPRWFMKAAHINPPETIQAAKELGARLILPIHWGTFGLGDELPCEPILYLKELLTSESEQKAFLWEPGKVIDL